MHFLTRPWRISGVAGILFVVLSFIAAGMNVQPPAYDQGQATLVSWFGENGHRYRVGHFVAGLAFLLFYFPFFAGLCEKLREAEGTPAIWSRVAWAGAIICPAAGTACGMFIAGGALLGGRVSPEAAEFGLAANFYGLVVSCALSGVAMIGAAVVILRTGIFWRGWGWMGALIGLAAILGCAAVVENNPSGLFAAISGLAWLGFFAWIVGLSIALIRARDIPEQA
jgi:hypothetical protein